jgi:hypothetical protein
MSAENQAAVTDPGWTEEGYAQVEAQQATSDPGTRSSEPVACEAHDTEDVEVVDVGSDHEQNLSPHQFKREDPAIEKLCQIRVRQVGVTTPGVSHHAKGDGLCAAEAATSGVIRECVASDWERGPLDLTYLDRMILATPQTGGPVSGLELGLFPPVAC